MNQQVGRCVRSGMCGYLLAILVSACATTPTPVTVEKPEMQGVQNYSELRATETFAGARVGFGGSTKPTAMSALRSAGYATVISLRFGDETDVDHGASRQAAEAAGLRYLELPLSSKQFSPATIQGVLDAMSSAGQQPVYLHCGSASRAAAVWMIGRVRLDGLDRDAATAEVENIAGKPEAAIRFADGFLEAPPQ